MILRAAIFGHRSQLSDSARACGFAKPQAARAAFTLLEMILALAIGLVLLAGLYAMMSSQLSHAQAGRTSIQEATLVRSLFARMSDDIASSLGPYDPRQQTDTSS